MIISLLNPAYLLQCTVGVLIITQLLYTYCIDLILYSICTGTLLVLYILHFVIVLPDLLTVSSELRFTQKMPAVK